MNSSHFCIITRLYSHMCKKKPFGIKSLPRLTRNHPHFWESSLLRSRDMDKRILLIFLASLALSEAVIKKTNKLSVLILLPIFKSSFKQNCFVFIHVVDQLQLEGHEQSQQGLQGVQGQQSSLEQVRGFAAICNQQVSRVSLKSHL